MSLDIPNSVLTERPAIESHNNWMTDLQSTLDQNNNKQPIGSHEVAEQYPKVPQELHDKLKGDDYKLPTVELKPGSGAGEHIVIVTGNGVEAPEFTEMYKALKHSGADVKVATPDWMWQYQNPPGAFSLAQWLDNDHYAQSDISVSQAINMVKNGQVDALYVPGGAGNTAALRTDSGVQELVRDVHNQGDDVWTICHGPQVIISSHVFPEGTVLTGSPDIRPDDLPNAGFVVPKESVAWDSKEHLLSGQDPNALDPFLEGVQKRINAIQGMLSKPTLR